MGYPINFYQYQDSGILEFLGYPGPNNSWIVTGYNVAPFVYGLFSGFYTPQSILIAGGNRVVNIESELDPNLWPPSFQVNFKGEQTSSNKDNFNLNLSFQGNFVPGLSDTGAFLCVNFTGQQNSIVKDINNYFISISGDFASILNDKPTLNVYFNGDFTGCLSDRPSLFVVFSGNFNKVQKDFAFLN